MRQYVTYAFGVDVCSIQLNYGNCIAHVKQKVPQLVHQNTRLLRRLNMPQILHSLRRSSRI